MAKKRYRERRWPKDMLEEPGGTERLGNYILLSVGTFPWIQVFWDGEKEELVTRCWYEAFDEVAGGDTKAKKKKKKSGS